jgi:cytochrome c
MADGGGTCLLAGWQPQRRRRPTRSISRPPRAQFKKSCGTCHVAAADAGPRQGPNLFGVVGRTAGEVAGFKYSPAFAAGSGGIVWDEATLDRWLTDPQSVIPGAVMPYKQADPDKRRLVIEYLKTRR